MLCVGCGEARKGVCQCETHGYARPGSGHSPGGRPRWRLWKQPCQCVWASRYGVSSARGSLYQALLGSELVRPVNHTWLAASRPMGVNFQRTACLMAGAQRGPSRDT